MFSQILSGLVVSGMGLAMILYRRHLYNFTGEIGFARKMFGGGGTLLFYALLGAIIIFLGIFMIFGYNPFDFGAFRVDDTI